MATSAIKDGVLNVKNYATEGLEKIRSKSWAEPTAKAMNVTASILDGIGCFVPYVGVVAGALKWDRRCWILSPQARTCWKILE